MPGLAYLFERFPAFTQTFCYREVAELNRQGVHPKIFSIRKPTGEPSQAWDGELVRQVQCLPNEEALIKEVGRSIRKSKLPSSVVSAIEEWGRQTDFLRLYQAAWLGPRLQELGIRRVHSHFGGMATRTLYWVERFFGIDFSFTAHANDIFSPKEFAVNLGKLVEAATAVISVSDFGSRFLQKRFPEHAAKFHRIYNGIDLARFRPADFVASVPLIISVGRLIEKKGFSDLIEACRLLKSRDCDFRCEIIGEGPLERELRRQIGLSGLAEIISLGGALPEEEIAERLAVATVFALSSVPEKGGGMDNLPTVIAEAMAAGLPVVATPVAGIPEMVEQGKTGFLVAEHQPVALADAIERLLGDISLAREFGKNGRGRARKLFSIEQNVRELAELFASQEGPLP